MPIWKTLWTSWDSGPTMRTTITTQPRNRNVLPGRPGTARRAGAARQRGYQGEYESDGTVRTMPARPSYPTRDAELDRPPPVPATDDSSVQPRPSNPAVARPRRQQLVGDPLHGPAASLRLRARDRRQVQRGSAGHHEPRGHRPRCVASAHRLRQRLVLRPQRQHGEGRHGRVPAEADPVAQGGYDGGEFDRLSVHCRASSVPNMPSMELEPADRSQLPGSRPSSGATTPTRSTTSGRRSPRRSRPPRIRRPPWRPVPGPRSPSCRRSRSKSPAVHAMPGRRQSASDEDAETISRTLLLAQRTADTDGRRGAAPMPRPSRSQGARRCDRRHRQRRGRWPTSCSTKRALEAAPLGRAPSASKAENEVQALLARRDFAVRRRPPRASPRRTARATARRRGVDARARRASAGWPRRDAPAAAVGVCRDHCRRRRPAAPPSRCRRRFRAVHHGADPDRRRAADWSRRCRSSTTRHGRCGTQADDWPTTAALAGDDTVADGERRVRYGAADEHRRPTARSTTSPRRPSGLGSAAKTPLITGDELQITAAGASSSRSCDPTATTRRSPPSLRKNGRHGTSGRLSRTERVQPVIAGESEWLPAAGRQQAGWYRGPLLVPGNRTSQEPA